MKAKRKLFVSLVTLMLLFCCSMLFAACNDVGGTGESGTIGSNPTTYTVAFKMDGRNYDIAFVEEGKTVMLPTDPKKDGYTFGGWFTDNGYTNAFDATSAVIAETMVYAKMTANVYTITYEADGGTNTNTATTFTVEDKIMLADAEKSGFTFDGWYLNGERISSIPKGTTGNVTLTAKYTAVDPDTHRVAFLVGGKNYDVQLVKDGNLAVLPTTPETAGYTFGGWFTDNGYTNAFDATSAVTAETTVYAKMTANTYTLTYNANGGTHANTASTFTVEDEVRLLDATKSGYAFEGWYWGEDRVSFIPKGTTENVTLTAKYIKNGYTITYENTEMSYGNKNPKAYAVDSDTIELTNIYRNGYEFKGWYDNEECQGSAVTEITTGSTGDKTLYAKFELIKYKVTYKNTAGAANAENEEYNTEFSIEQPIYYLYPLEREGYTFGGWYVGDDKVETLEFEDHYDDVTLTAKWTVIECKLEYENLNGADNSQNPQLFTIESGEVEISNLADKLDYEFKGWSYMNGTPVKDLVIDPEETLNDMTLTAVWELKEQYVGLDYFVSMDNARVIINGVTDVNLTKITLPDETSFIFKGAFETCTKLESISLPFVGKDNNKSLGTTIASEKNDDYCFSYLFGGDDKIPSTLKNVTVRGGNIGAYAFYMLDKIETLVLEGDMDFVGENAFYKCYSLETLTMHNSTLSVIKSEAFYNCENLLKITIPSTMSSIGSAAFYNDYSITEIYNLSEINITPGDNRNNGEIGRFAKKVNSSLDVPSGFSTDDNGNIYYAADDGKIFSRYKGAETTFTIPSDVKIINANVFKDRKDMVRINLPEGLTQIGECAFQNCTATINIPSTVTYIGKYAFDNCTAQLTIPESVITFEEYAFRNTSCGEELTFSKNGTNINMRAFVGCTNLKKVNFTGENIIVEYESFKDCSNLEFVTLTGKGLEINGYVFENTNIKDVDIAAENADVSGAFRELKNLKTLTVSADGVVIDGTFFQTTLESVVINGSNVEIGTLTFYENKNLTSLVFNAADTKIGNRAFEGCSALERVTLPSDITGMGESSFKNCTSLRTVIFGDKLETIEKQTFYGCSSLTNIKFGNSLKTLKEEAFRYCGKLGVVNIPMSLNTIEKYVFGETDSLHEINLHDGMTLAKFAFYRCGFKEFFLPNDVSGFADASLLFLNGLKGTEVYYYGTQEQLDNAIATLGPDLYTTFYPYSESEPQRNANNTAYVGNYWHYNEWGEPELWNYDVFTLSISEGENVTNILGAPGYLTDGDKGNVYAAAALSRVEITIKPSTPVALSQFTLTIGAGADRPGRIPKEWSVSGTNVETGEWETIFSTTNGGFSEQNYQSKTFTISEENANKILSEFRFSFKVNGYASDGEEALTLEWSEIELTFKPVDWTKSEGYDFRYKAIDGCGDYLNVADGNTSTNWALNYDSTKTEMSGDVVLRANEAFVLGSYYLTTNGNGDSYENTGYGISKWTVYGTNDQYYYQNDNAWVQIDSVIGNATTIYNKDGNKFVFSLDKNNTAYKFYKFVFVKTDGEVASAIGEIELVEKPTYSVVAGTASTGNNGKENYDKAADGNTGTKWCVNFDTTNGVYVIFEADKKATIYGYTFTTADDNSKEIANGRNPKSWTIYGSNSSNCVNDGYSGWTEVCKVTGKTIMQDVNYTPYSFTVETTSSYKYFKIVFTENGGNDMLQLSEIELNLR